MAVEENGALGRRLTVTIPAERIEEEVARRLEGLGKRAKVKGFRPGKAPAKVIRQQYGATVRGDVVDELMRSHYADAVAEQKLAPVASPQFTGGRTTDDGGYTFVAELEVYPEFEPKGIDGLNLERPRVEIADADVDTVLERLRRQRSTWAEKAGPAESGDRVVVDFEGRIDGEPFEGGTASEMPVTLGAGELIPGFEEGLVGIAAGESRVLDLDFPQDYRKRELAGKRASFRVSARRVERQDLPALDETFAQAFGVAGGGVAGLRERVRASMTEELEERINAHLRRQVGDQLLVANDVPVPQALIEDEIRRQQQATLRRLGIAPDGSRVPQLPSEPFAEEAERRVRLGLILSRLIEREEFRPDPARIEKRIAEIAAQASDPAAQARAIRSDNAVMREIEMLVLEDAAYDWLIERAAVGGVERGFFEFMEPPRVNEQENVG